MVKRKSLHIFAHALTAYGVFLSKNESTLFGKRLADAQAACIQATENVAAPPIGRSVAVFVSASAQLLLE